MHLQGLMELKVKAASRHVCNFYLIANVVGCRHKARNLLYSILYFFGMAVCDKQKQHAALWNNDTPHRLLRNVGQSAISHYSNKIICALFLFRSSQSECCLCLDETPVVYNHQRLNTQQDSRNNVTSL